MRRFPGSTTAAASVLVLAAAAAPARAQESPAPTAPSASAPPAAYAAPPGAASAQVSGVKRADPGGFGRWYGTVEVRHHLNTYYSPRGYYSHQDPSMHARLQLGGIFYDGAVDAYATLGAFKEAHSQQVLQRRPELSLDVYPVRLPNLTVLQYSLLQVPVSQANSGITRDSDAEEKDNYSSSTTYLIGLAPQVKLPLAVGASRLELKAGLDGWTKMYSRKQYTQTYQSPGGSDQGDETDQGRLGLSGGAAGAPAGNPPIEDYALHYQAQAMAGGALSPSFAKGLSVDTSVFYDSRYDPQYERQVNGNIGFHYAAQRYSYYRIRLHYDINDRLAVTDDFYHFHDGFFQENRYGADQRRFRNIARITVKL